MSWRRGGFISEQLTGVLIPMCVFGMVAVLILHLIDLRAVFIAGGEAKLRLAMLAFIWGVILLERLAYLHGRSLARAYGWALGLSMTLFTAYYTGEVRLPAPFIVVFGLTAALCAVLWWAAYRVSEACSVSDDKTVDQAAESGILRAIRRRTQEKRGVRSAERGEETKRSALPKDSSLSALRTPHSALPKDPHWAEKLSGRHPGRVLVYFSLFAIPLFGLGLLLFDPRGPELSRLGFLFFVYLWCTLSLLFLSSLRQLSVYFCRREVSMPDVIGLPWLALGFTGVTAALVLAFALPQPPSPLSLPVREQILASYQGWENAHGFKDGSRRGGQAPPLEAWSQDNLKKFDKRYEEIDKIKDPDLSKTARDRDVEAAAAVAMSAAVYDSLREVFRILVKVAVRVGAAGLVIVVIITLVVFVKRLREGAGEALTRGKKWVLGDGKKKPAPPATRRFPLFGDPFNNPEYQTDRSALVRYLWEALLALCADAGAPCSPDQTPLEFVDLAPPALAGFETQARFIARLYTFSEFSSQPVPDASLPELRQFWLALQRHAQ